jgi:outer membrane lipoprotein-sorting protein
MLRRVSIARLLIGCAVTVLAGISLTALALALGSGPTPPAKPLAQAVHDALSAPRPQGFSAEVQFTDHLLDGAQLASGEGEEGTGGSLATSPLLSGASGRMWVSAAGEVRIELQAEKGDTQIVYDGSELELYDASSNTLYRLKAPREESSATDQPSGSPPTLGEVEHALAHLSEHARVSAAEPADIGGRPAYEVKLSPQQGGSLFAGVSLAFDADNGVPLRAAVYSTQSSSPVLELTTSSISYGPVAESVFQIQPPADAKVEEVQIPHEHANKESAEKDHGQLTIHGHGPTAIAVLEQRQHGSQSSLPAGLPHVKLGSVTATELQSELGTLLTFERAGIRYLVLGSLEPGPIEAFARGL